MPLTHIGYNIYKSCVEDASNAQLLYKLGIRLVFSLGKKNFLKDSDKHPNIVYVNKDFDEGKDTDWAGALEDKKLFSLAKATLDKGEKVLFHCEGGRCRTPFLICGFLINSLDHNLRQSVSRSYQYARNIDMWEANHKALVDFARKLSRQGTRDDLKLLDEGEEGMLTRGEGVGSPSLRAKRRFCRGNVEDVQDPLLETDFSGCPEGVGEVTKNHKDFWKDYQLDDEGWKKHQERLKRRTKEYEDEKKKKAQEDRESKNEKKADDVKEE